MSPTTMLKSRPAQAPAQPWRNVLPIHPAAELLPRMSQDELRELGEDIRRRGLQTPIAILVGEDNVERLLDGISRLDAMDMAGLEIVTDGELNLDVVHTQTVPGNVDPVGFVLSANVHRRHLTREQKEDLIKKLLKVNPSQSNLKIAKLVKRDDKTVAKVRKKMEARSEIPNVETRTDSKGREQPARKPKPAARATSSKPVVKTPEEPAQDGTSIAVTLDYHFNALLALCGDGPKWPEPNAGRRARRVKAMKKLRSAWSDLVELSKPAPKRGRPAKKA